MHHHLIKLYHRLPSRIRDVVASARGYQLRRLRFGPETELLAHEAIERETWGVEKWKEWKNERLCRILHRAATMVPFYRELWFPRLKQGNKTSYEELANWPVLKKEHLRASPTKFLANDRNPTRMWCEHTSGSTGTPLTLWQSRETIRSWHAIFEARWRFWYGLSRHDQWAIMGGQLVVPIEQITPPFWVHNSALHQLYLSVNHLSGATAKSYLDVLARSQVRYIWGYASALYTLATLALQHGWKPCPLQAVISNAEPLYEHQRQVISQAFGCRVYDTYGMSEMVCAASECNHGAMHLWPEVGVWEVLRDDADEPVEPGVTGRLVCTGLLNPDMPLIRYETGDRVAMAELGTSCACGRTLPILMSVEGRTDDVIITLDGRRIGRLDPVFKANFPIREAQIIQDRPDHLLVLVVPGSNCTGILESAIAGALRERVGGMLVTVERVAFIPRGPNGKFKMVVSKLSSPPQLSAYEGG
jgi:phenylacetate-CoA ligase